MKAGIMNQSLSKTKPVVQASGLSKTFRDFWHRPVVRAVNGIDFEINGGEVFGFLGPNGSGKSTTLRLILGLLKPSGGRIAVFGSSPHDVNSKLKIGYLPEESCFYPFLTAEEALLFYGSLFNMAGTIVKERVRQLLEMVGLKHAAQRLIGEFSKGMLRRIGLAQALINDPDLVILDEPTSGLDPVGCRQVKDLILLLAGRGKTIIISSHLLADVENVCHRVAIMNNGDIIVHGRLVELLENTDLCRFSIKTGSKEQMRAIMDFLSRQTGTTAKMDHPRKTLEQFFIETVEQALPAAKLPSGVAWAEKIAPFLAGKDLDRKH
jgi:ABC-2 type transport system ATP-binding protein